MIRIPQLLLQPFSSPSSEERDNPSQFLSGGMSQVFTRAINGQLRRAIPTRMSQKQRPHDSSSEREVKREQNQLRAGRSLLPSPWPNPAAPHSAFALFVPWPAQHCSSSPAKDPEYSQMPCTTLTSFLLKGSQAQTETWQALYCAWQHCPDAENKWGRRAV